MYDCILLYVYVTTSQVLKTQVDKFVTIAGELSGNRLITEHVFTHVCRIKMNKKCFMMHDLWNVHCGELKRNVHYHIGFSL